MKEGYLQTKIRELDYKLKQQMETAEQIHKELQHLQLSKKERKQLLKKIKEFETFQQRIEQDLLSKNKQMLQDLLKESTSLIDERVKNALNKRFKPFERSIEAKTAPLNQLEQQHEQLSQALQETSYLRNLVELLIEELIKEHVFSSEKLEILTKRARIRSEK